VLPISMNQIKQLDLKRHVFRLTFLLLSYSFFSPVAQSENENSLSLLVGESSNEFFSEQSSSLTTHHKGLLYSRTFNQHLSFSLSANQSEGDGRWLAFQLDDLTAYNRAETESDGYGVGLTWTGEDYSFDFGYNNNRSEERSLTYLPIVLERLQSDTQSFNLSISGNKLVSEISATNQLNLDWSIGIQHAEFDARIVDIIGANSEFIVRTDVGLRQLSSYVELDLNYWLEQTSFVWSPFLSVTWNLEIDSSGQQSILLARGGDSRPVNLLDGRFTNGLKIPDSGEWQAGVALLLDNGISFDLTYSESISTEFPTQTLSASVNVFF
jgi:hypothetical protein